jgi:hypothetical protein
MRVPAVSPARSGCGLPNVSPTMDPVSSDPDAPELAHPGGSGEATNPSDLERRSAPVVKRRPGSRKKPTDTDSHHATGLPGRMNPFHVRIGIS